MMAGTSTGSIISAALAYPNPKDKDKEKKDQRPWYFMQEIMNIYTKTGNKIFVASSSSAMWSFLIFLLMVVGCAFLGWSINYKYFNHEEDAKKYEEVKKKGERVKLTPVQKTESENKMK